MQNMVEFQKYRRYANLGTFCSNWAYFHKNDTFLCYNQNQARDMKFSESTNKKFTKNF